MIRWHIKHILINLYGLTKLFFHLVNLDTLCMVRYKVISELGEEQLRDILHRIDENKKHLGHSDYHKAVRDNHLQFYKHYYERAK